MFLELINNSWAISPMSIELLGHMMGLYIPIKRWCFINQFYIRYKELMFKVISALSQPNTSKDLSFNVAS